MFFKMIFGPWTATRTTNAPASRSDDVKAVLNPLLFLMHGRG